jgi:hypothetical protein
VEDSAREIFEPVRVDDGVDWCECARGG